MADRSSEDRRFHDVSIDDSDTSLYAPNGLNTTDKASFQDASVDNSDTSLYVPNISINDTSTDTTVHSIDEFSTGNGVNHAQSRG